MIVFGGVYSVVHILVITLKKIKSILRPANVLALTIVLSVLSAVFLSVITLARGAADDSPNLRFYSNLFLSCEPIEQITKSRKIVFRIDDVQAFAWREVQEDMIKDALDSGITPLLGIIPYQFEDDEELYKYIRDNRCNLEIAQHGWNHSLETGGTQPEFGKLLKQYAKERIEKGKPGLEYLAGKKLTTFIPPNNQYSLGAAEAIHESGFSVISAEGEGRFDYTVSTFNSDWGRLNETWWVIEQCKNELDDGKLCVVMSHPQDYADGQEKDKDKYREYLSLIKGLKELDAMFVTPEKLIGIESLEPGIAVDNEYFIQMVKSNTERYKFLIQKFNEQKL